MPLGLLVLSINYIHCRATPRSDVIECQRAVHATMTSKTIDIKISFQQYKCQPGREEYNRFERNLFAHGGISDAEGWSLTECLMRTDDGAVLLSLCGGAHAPPTAPAARNPPPPHPHGHKRSVRRTTASVAKCPVGSRSGYKSGSCGGYKKWGNPRPLPEGGAHLGHVFRGQRGSRGGRRDSWYGPERQKSEKTNFRKLKSESLRNYSWVTGTPGKKTGGAGTKVTLTGHTNLQTPTNGRC